MALAAVYTVFVTALRAGEIGYLLRLVPPEQRKRSSLNDDIVAAIIIAARGGKEPEPSTLTRWVQALLYLLIIERCEPEEALGLLNKLGMKECHRRYGAHLREQAHEGAGGDARPTATGRGSKAKPAGVEEEPASTPPAPPPNNTATTSPVSARPDGGMPASDPAQDYMGVVPTRGGRSVLLAFCNGAALEIEEILEKRPGTLIRLEGTCAVDLVVVASVEPVPSEGSPPQPKGATARKASGGAPAMRDEVKGQAKGRVLAGGKADGQAKGRTRAR